MTAASERVQAAREAYHRARDAAMAKATADYVAARDVAFYEYDRAPIPDLPKYEQAKRAAEIKHRRDLSAAIGGPLLRELNRLESEESAKEAARFAARREAEQRRYRVSRFKRARAAFTTGPRAVAGGGASHVTLTDRGAGNAHPTNHRLRDRGQSGAGA